MNSDPNLVYDIQFPPSFWALILLLLMETQGPCWEWLLKPLKLQWVDRFSGRRGHHTVSLLRLPHGPPLAALLWISGREGWLRQARLRIRGCLAAEHQQAQTKIMSIRHFWDNGDSKLLALSYWPDVWVSFYTLKKRMLIN